MPAAPPNPAAAAGDDVADDPSDGVVPPPPPPPPPPRLTDSPPSMKADLLVMRGSNLEDETPEEDACCGSSGCIWLPSGPVEVGDASA